MQVIGSSRQIIIEAWKHVVLRLSETKLHLKNWLFKNVLSDRMYSKHNMPVGIWQWYQMETVETQNCFMYTDTPISSHAVTTLTPSSQSLKTEIMFCIDESYV